jgi:uncharacterized protein (DUF3084 family)
MSTIAKVFVVLNLVFALFLVGANSALLSKSEDYKGKFENEVAARKADNEKSKADIDKLNGDKKSLDDSLKQKTDQLNDKTSELQAATATSEQVRNDNNQLRNGVDGLNNSLKSLQTELADVQKRNKELMDKNDEFNKAATQAEKEKLDAQDDRTRLEGDLKRANDDVAAKETQIAALVRERDNLRAEKEALVKAGVPVEKIIGGNVPAIEGRVNAVGPNASFVVLSVGEKEGVRIGFPFDVYRGSEYVGQVVVDAVLPESSTARVTVHNKGIDFKPLDKATTHL